MTRNRSLCHALLLIAALSLAQTKAPAKEIKSAQENGGYRQATPNEQSDRDSRAKPVLRRRSDTDFDPAAPYGKRKEQADQTGAVASGEDDIIRLEASLVNLNVMAADRSGRSVADLKKEDFLIFEDGVQQEIAYFEPVTAPVNLVLLLDLSGSTRDKIMTMKETAKRFIDSLNPDDRIAVATFTTNFLVVSNFTSDRQVLQRRIDSIRGRDGDTAFYDAMWATLDMLDGVKEARKAVVVLTDGVDSSFSPTEEGSERSFDQLLSRMMEEDAAVFPIYLDTEEQAGEYYSREAFATARKQLEAMAEQTAGTLFKADSAEDLSGVYRRVASELHMLYSLAYAPKNPQNNGEWRKVSVKLKRNGVFARTRRGYYAR